MAKKTPDQSGRLSEAGRTRRTAASASLALLLLFTGVAAAGCGGSDPGGNGGTTRLPGDTGVTAEPGSTVSAGTETTVTDDIDDTDDTDPASSEPGTSGDAYGVGETADIEGLRITLEEIDEEDGEDNYRPDEGQVYIVAEFDMKNQGELTFLIPGIVNFKYFVDGEEVFYDANALLAADEEPFTENLGPGADIDGAVGFQAPADWQEIEIHYYPFFGDESMVATFLVKRQD